MFYAEKIKYQSKCWSLNNITFTSYDEKIKPRSQTITKQHERDYVKQACLPIKMLLIVSVKRLEVPTALNAPQHKNKCQQLHNPRAAGSRSNNEPKHGKKKPC